MKLWRRVELYAVIHVTQKRSVSCFLYLKYTIHTRKFDDTNKTQKYIHDFLNY